MPLARIDLAMGKPLDYRKTIGEVVYDAMVETLKAPKDDRFQIITEHAGDDFIVDPIAVSGPSALVLSNNTAMPADRGILIARALLETGMAAPGSS